MSVTPPPEGSEPPPSDGGPQPGFDVDQALQSLIHTSPFAIVILDVDGLVMLWNRAAERIFGWQAHEVIGKPLPAVPDEGRNEHDEMRRVKLEGHTIDGLVVKRRKRDGTQVDVSIWSAPLYDATGRRITGSISVGIDVTDRLRSESAQRLLGGAGSLISSALSPDALWLGIGRLIVPELADYLIIDIVEDDGSLRRVAAAHVDAEKAAVADELRRRFPPDTLDGIGVGSVLRERSPLLTPVIEDWQLESAARDQAQLDLWRRLGLKSSIMTPLLARGRTIGVMTLAITEAGRRYDGRDLALAIDLAARLALVIDNAQLYAEAQAAREAAERAEHRWAFLARASAELSASLDFEQTLASVARLAVPELADWCAVDMLRDGALHRLAVEHVDPAMIAIARDVHRRWPTDLADAHGIARVLRTGESIFFNDLTSEQLAAGARDEEHLGILERLKITAGIIVPIVVGGAPAGAITLVSAESGRRYAQADLALALELANRASLAVENTRLYRNARDASRLKDEFLATVSHELRTPLNSILGWARLLNSGGLDAARAGRATEIIVRNAHAQGQIIEDILDVSRAITGKLRLDLAPVDLSAVVSAVADSLRPTADAKSIRVDVVVSPSRVEVTGDAGRLQQVVWNLASNAIKFTAPGGRVSLRTSTDAGYAEIAVEDTGAGIEPEFLPFVFDRFRQADGSSTRRHGGLGLGLSIVRHLTELHGGTIRVASPGADQGSTFTLRVPLRVEAPIEDGADRPVEPDAGSEGREARSLAGVRVLLVEDEDDARDVLSFMVEQAGAETYAVESAARAFEVFREWRPDIVVSDIGMPDEDGYSLVARLRSAEVGSGRKTPAVALTAYARPEDRIRALAAGFTQHVAKPVEPEELIAVLVSLAGR